MIWFTSDTHFGHALMAEERGFSNVDQMDNALIKNWNSRVRKKENVYHLGDVGLCSEKRLLEILCALNGNIFLVRGNHDFRRIKGSSITRCFAWIKDTYELKLNQETIWLSHYAHHVWPKSHYGSLHLYGHSHGKLEKNTKKTSMDVGVDVHNFAPVSHENVFKLLKG